MSAVVVETERPAYDLVLWHLVISDALDYREQTGERPEVVWRLIHRRNYRAARAAMDELLGAARAEATRTAPECPQEESK